MTDFIQTTSGSSVIEPDGNANAELTHHQPDNVVENRVQQSSFHDFSDFNQVIDEFASKKVRKVCIGATVI